MHPEEPAAPPCRRLAVGGAHGRDVPAGAGTIREISTPPRSGACSSARGRSTTRSTAGARSATGTTIAIIRLEQLYPFPAEELAAALRRYPARHAVQWVQEEPANQGAWSFVRWRIEELLAPGRWAALRGPPGGGEPGHGQPQDPSAEEAAIVEARAAAPARASRRSARRAQCSRASAAGHRLRRRATWPPRSRSPSSANPSPRA